MIRLNSFNLFDSFSTLFFRFSFIVDIVWYFIVLTFSKSITSTDLHFSIVQLKWFSVIRLKCQNDVNIVRKLEFSLDSMDKIIERETNRKFAIYLSNGNKIQLDIFDIHMWSSNIIIIHRLFETLSISNFWWPIPIQMKINASKWIKMGKSKNV